jgi:hypothetical protein
VLLTVSSPRYFLSLSLSLSFFQDIE